MCAAIQGLKFTIMGCGNRQYVHFNQSAKLARAFDIFQFGSLLLETSV